MNILSQVSAVTAVSLRSVPERAGTSLVVIVGIAGVVAVLVSILSMSAGFQSSLERSSDSRRAIVLSKGAESEAGSGISRQETQVIRNAAGIRRSADGKPIVSAEVLVVALVARARDGADTYATLRGVEEQWSHLRPELKLIEGRTFRTGVRELIVGKAAQRQFSGLTVGQSITLRGGDWTVVGVFDASGSSRDSELMADAGAVVAAYNLESFNSVSVMLESPRPLDALEQSLTADPTALLEAKSEPEYFATVSRPVYRLMQRLSYSVGGVMAFGALFAALNTMYAAIASRRVEIATLRALGFDRVAIVISVLIEALLLSAAGAALGALIAVAIVDGNAVSTIGNHLGTQLVYTLSVTPETIITGTALACLVGLLGGILPAIQAARTPISSALQSA